METVRIVNTLTCALGGPTVVVAGADMSVRFIPGGTNVPVDYLVACETLDSAMGPGKVWQQWLKSGAIVVDERAGATDLPEGPEPPKTLKEYKTPAALAFVSVETNLDALRRWKRDRRPEVKAACEARLHTLAPGR